MTHNPNDSIEPTQRAAPELRSGFLRRVVANRWAFVPFLLLGTSCAVIITTVMSAVVGHPLGIEPQWDVRAEHFEDELRQQAQNDRLRWVVSPNIEDLSDSGYRVSLTVTDKHGFPILAQSITVSAIPLAKPDTRLSITADPVGEGKFCADFPYVSGGMWDFTVVVATGEDTYTDSFRRRISAVK